MKPLTAPGLELGELSAINAALERARVKNAWFAPIPGAPRPILMVVPRGAAKERERTIETIRAELEGFPTLSVVEADHRIARPRAQRKGLIRLGLVLAHALVVVVIGAAIHEQRKSPSARPPGAPLEVQDGKPIALATAELEGLRYGLLGAFVPQAGQGYVHTRKQITVIVNLALVNIGATRSPRPAGLVIRGADGHVYRPVGNLHDVRSDGRTIWLKDVFVISRRVARPTRLVVVSQATGQTRSMRLPLYFVAPDPPA